MKKISVLQIADTNWQEQYIIPDNLEWTFVTPQDVMSLLPEDVGIAEEEDVKKKKTSPLMSSLLIQ
ncbi:hypothetical protein [Streptococcus sp. oral taxon 056]|uniref:hypothetical protein n=1 Tax=Streptococcus sp. oral taxon 056 TaxID=712620 RepID=UPI0003162C70|nr:hypothetical protein [Streptococcus sp. oral taxon 056]